MNRTFIDLLTLTLPDAKAEALIKSDCAEVLALNKSVNSFLKVVFAKTCKDAKFTKKIRKKLGVIQSLGLWIFESWEFQ